MLKLFLLIGPDFKICGTIETIKLKISTESWKLYNLNVKCRNLKKQAILAGDQKKLKRKLVYLKKDHNKYSE